MPSLSLRPAGARLALEPRISLFLEPELRRSDAEALGKRLVLIRASKPSASYRERTRSKR